MTAALRLVPTESNEGVTVARWIIHEADDGRVTLVKDRRTVDTFPTVEDAAHEVRKKMEPGDRVVHEAPDGYRTKQGPRRHWREAPA